MNDDPKIEGALSGSNVTPLNSIATALRTQSVNGSLPSDIRMLLTIAAARIEQDEKRQDMPPMDPFVGTAEEIAVKLWDLLDQIDEASDLAKDDDKLYRKLVHRAHVQRQRYGTTDGYNLVLHIKQREEE